MIKVTIASGPQKMIEELFSKRTRNSLGKIVSRKQDLRFEQLRIFYEEAGFSLNENFASNLEMLETQTSTIILPICFQILTLLLSKLPSMHLYQGLILLRTMNMDMPV